MNSSLSSAHRQGDPDARVALAAARVSARSAMRGHPRPDIDDVVAAAMLKLVVALAQGRQPRSMAAFAAAAARNASVDHHRYLSAIKRRRVDDSDTTLFQQPPAGAYAMEGVVFLRQVVARGRAAGSAGQSRMLVLATDAVIGILDGSGVADLADSDLRCRSRGVHHLAKLLVA